MVCYHYSVTDPNLKPIFCVHSSIKPVNVISNAFINDETSNLKPLSQVNLLGIFISDDLFLGEYCKSIG